MITVSLTAVSVVYAFWCDIRISNKSNEIRRWLEKEAPGPWSNLNFVARSWNGGQPGIKLLHRKQLVRLPGFEEKVEQLRDLERRMLWGIAVAMLALVAAIGGTHLWDWQW